MECVVSISFFLICHFSQICTMTILDDSQNPTVEGNETFIVYLNSVQKAKTKSSTWGDSDNQRHTWRWYVNGRPAGRTSTCSPLERKSGVPFLSRLNWTQLFETARHRYSIASKKAVLPAGTMVRGCTPANSSQASEKFSECNKYFIFILWPIPTLLNQYYWWQC